MSGGHPASKLNPGSSELIKVPEQASLRNKGKWSNGKIKLGASIGEVTTTAERTECISRWPISNDPGWKT